MGACAKGLPLGCVPLPVASLLYGVLRTIVPFPEYYDSDCRYAGLRLFGFVRGVMRDWGRNIFDS